MAEFYSTQLSDLTTTKYPVNKDNICDKNLLLSCSLDSEEENNLTSSPMPAQHSLGSSVG